MKFIQANCRVQFTNEDIGFVVRVLGTRPGDGERLSRLMADPDTRDLILDDEALFRALLEERGCLRVSHHFYFYVLVRQVLKRSGIEDRDVADYVAELLTQYSREEAMTCVIPRAGVRTDYFFEMMSALDQVDEITGFFVRAHIGNSSLFLSGIFPQRVKSRSERRGFPDLGYYEALGESNFKVARHHRLAERYSLASIFSTLAERFREARMALNDAADRLFWLHDADPGLAGMFRSN